MCSPFDLSKQIAELTPGQRLRKYRFLQLFCKEYGITDPNKYFHEYRKKILDRAEKDPFGVTQYQSLDEWWDAKEIETHYALLAKEIAEEEAAA
jgi:hypothetical protein